MSKPVKDPVNPAHYRSDTVMRIIKDFDLGFCLDRAMHRRVAAQSPRCSEVENPGAGTQLGAVS